MTTTNQTATISAHDTRLEEVAREVLAILDAEAAEASLALVDANGVNLARLRLRTALAARDTSANTRAQAQQAVA